MSSRYKGSLLSATAATNSQSAAVGVWRPNEVLQAVNASLWPAGITYDAYFKYVTLLLHGDGTNGAQNNTFLDSSTNNFTITRNGNTTQGTFTPYGANWSNYFDGSGDYLSVASNAAFALGTSNFTIEMWMYSGANGTGTRLAGNGTGGSWAANRWIMATSTPSNPNKFNFTPYNYASGTADFMVSTSTFNNNQWMHVAITRSGNAWAMFVNGVREVYFPSTSFSVDGGSSEVFNLGRSNISGDSDWAGYVSNFRMVKGTAIYDPTSTTITVPTAPLTAITNTSLLTCQSNRFIDNSSNAFTITRNGDVSIQRFSPFSPSAAYSTSVIGGSGYFDGSGDYLNTASDAAFGVGSGDFTIELWVYLTANFDSTGKGLITASYNTNFAVIGYNGGGGNRVDFYVANSVLNTGTNYISLNTWAHVACVRSSGTTKIYFNGAEVASSASLTGTGAAAAVYVGTLSHDTPRVMTGYLSSVRLVKGTAVYTAAFTPPTAPLTAITNTSLLLSCTNGGIFDNAEMNDLETVGSAQISTSVYKYGTGSMSFNGTNSDLYIPSTQNFNFGTGDFTIELWINPTSQGGHGSSNNDCIIDFRPGVGSGAYGTLYIANSGTGVYWYVSAANRITGGAISNSTWTHIAVCRASGNTKLFINGTQSGSTYVDSTNYLVAPAMVGQFNDGTGAGWLNGYIDDLRITKGYARYTANFTPPTAPFPNQ